MDINSLLVIHRIPIIVDSIEFKYLDGIKSDANKSRKDLVKF